MSATHCDLCGEAWFSHGTACTMRAAPFATTLTTPHHDIDRNTYITDPSAIALIRSLKRMGYTPEAVRDAMEQLK